MKNKLLEHEEGLVKLRKKPRRSVKSYLQEDLKEQMTRAGLVFVEEHQFLKSRRWRFDFAFLDEKLAVEVQGGIWVQGRHSRGRGYLADLKKKEQALKNGWIVFECEKTMIEKGEALQTIVFLLEMRRGANDKDRETQERGDD